MLLFVLLQQHLAAVIMKPMLANLLIILVLLKMNVLIAMLDILVQNRIYLVAVNAQLGFMQILFLHQLMILLDLIVARDA